MKWATLCLLIDELNECGLNGMEDKQQEYKKQEIFGNDVKFKDADQKAKGSKELSNDVLESAFIFKE